MKYLNSLDIKQAVKSDERFRNLFPELKTEIYEFLHNPNCNCHNSLVNRILQFKDRLKEYFPNKIVIDDTASPKVTEFWEVINCETDQLAERLRRLPVGRKQLAIARYENQVTVIVNFLASVAE